VREISYLVVNWNTKALTDLCIRSLEVDSRGLDAEIIVVDNGSVDGSIEMIRTRFPGVRLICNGTNLGFARANNIGMRVSRGAFIYLVNSDAQLVPGGTRAMTACMKDSPRLALLGPSILDIEGRSQRSCWEFFTPGGLAKRVIGIQQSTAVMKRGGGFARLDRHFLSGCALMVRREAADRVGLFDEQFFFYGEDMDLSRRMIDGGWMIGQLPAAKAIHYGGGSVQRSNPRAAVQAERALFQYFRKHWQGPLAVIRLMRLVHHANRVTRSLLLRTAGFGDQGQSSRMMREGRAVIKWLLCEAGTTRG
jgi:GT2 family glycosyltransferase